MLGIQVLKSNGVLELFDEQKLIHSLQKSGASDEAIHSTVSIVKSKLKPGISTGELYALAYKTLNNQKKNNPSAIRYALKKSVMSLGPTGFPFERFIARIFQELGYTCEIGIMVQGKCIEHEIDIFAYNETEAICIEAKFHNEPHLKSDTKVALYVKARFDDLLGQTIHINQKGYVVNKGILITNTTFTDTAHNYVQCVGTFELLSWTKPKNKNLLHFIEDLNLYPVTVVPELNKKEIEFLIAQNILTCFDLKKNPSILDQAHVKPKRKEVILQTLNSICNC